MGGSIRRPQRRKLLRPSSQSKTRCNDAGAAEPPSEGRPMTQGASQGMPPLAAEAEKRAPEGRPGRSGRRDRRTKEARDARAGLALLSPTLIVVLVAVVLPILWTVMLAFQDIRLINIQRAGLFGNYTLENFQEV